MRNLAKLSMSEIRQSITVVGIDVGGERKGFHAVAIKDGGYCDQWPTKGTPNNSVEELVTWCRDRVKAQVVAIDAPCKWSIVGKFSRLAERDLMGCGIGCFSTPSQDVAMERLRQSKHDGVSNHYGWMLCGEALYSALTNNYSLCEDLATVRLPFCFETYPHAVTRNALGELAVARKKRNQRMGLLDWDSEDLAKLRSMDMIDAALCAYTAYHAVTGGECVTYGDKEAGLIIVPNGRLS
ncbi:MAG: DUF429 domain-containing protein [Ignavibacteria bacterium]|nr:DUF429 domain-containing protein [Ignavibacteria bacterium]